MSAPILLETLMLCFVAAAAATDLAARKIPNRLVLAGLGAALALRLWPGAGLDPLDWLGGALTGFLLFLPLYLLRGMAAGDVKLMAMVGAFCGPALALRIGGASCLIGGVMGLCIVLYRGRFLLAVANIRMLLSLWMLRAAGAPLAAPRLAPGASVGGMPYGVAIALGTLLLLWRRHG